MSNRVLPSFALSVSFWFSDYFISWEGTSSSPLSGENNNNWEEVGQLNRSEDNLFNPHVTTTAKSRLELVRKKYVNGFISTLNEKTFLFFWIYESELILVEFKIYRSLFSTVKLENIFLPEEGRGSRDDILNVTSRGNISNVYLVEI